MPIPLNAEMLAHCYDMLAATPTLSKWNLPPAEDIRFKVIKRKDRFAHHLVKGGVHHIEVSASLVGRFETLVSTMAHEMIHVHQDLVGLPRADDNSFAKFADKICKELDLDRLTF